ncbi:MAG: hypothetical protein JW834_02860 [Candidatus Diapherotrites archaeon]|nr:hypothetical protein [Candidatus Diapherotrites archaeon]
MKRLLLALALLFAGCVAPQGPAYNMSRLADQSFAGAVHSPADGAFLKASELDIRVSFKEPVVLMSFSVDGNDAKISTDDKMEYVSSWKMKDGAHNVSLVARDANDNEGSVSFSFTVDTKPPAVEVEPEDGGFVTDARPKIKLLFSEEAELLTASLDGDDMDFSSKDGVTYSFKPSDDLSDGKHSLVFHAVDRAGNEKKFVSWFKVGAGSDDEPPGQVLGFSASDEKSGGAIRLSWTAIEISDFLKYEVYTGTTLLNTLSSRTTNSYVVTALVNNQLYCFKIRAIDSDGKEGPFSSACATPTFKDTTLPSCSDGKPRNTIDYTSAVVNFTTSEDAKCRGSFNTDETFEEMDFAFEGSATTHTYSYSFSNGTTTKVYARCNDTAGNLMTSSYSWEFTVHTTSSDTTAPAISSVSSGTPANTSTTLTWTTNEASDSWVFFGTSSYTNHSHSSSIVTAHSISVSGLAVGTTYHYLVRSCDASSNCANGTDSTFTTSSSDATPPGRSGGSPSGNVSNASVVLQVTTNEPATCRWDGSSVNYASMSNTFNTSNNLTHTYAVTVSGDGTKIYYVRCVDASGNANTDDYLITFTADTAAPLFSSGPSAVPGAANATVSWTASEPVTGIVFYGIGSGDYTHSLQSAALTTTHSALLPSLFNATEYYYLVDICDTVSLCSNSTEQSFTTL